MVEQFGSVAGVFSGNQVYFLEDADRPGTEILQVADWCGDQV
jgi:hypothetical protein